MKQKPNRKPLTTSARGVLVAAACLLVAAAWGANRLERQGDPARSQPKVAPARAARVAERPPAAAQAPSAPEWRYDAVVRRNLFMPVAPPAGGGQKAAPGKLAALPPVTPMPVDALDLGEASPPPWTYAGYVTLSGTPMAIVENAASKKAEFLTVGQTLDGAAVSSISPQAIKLTRGGDTTELRISDAFTATPLNEPPRPAAQTGQGQGRRGRSGGGGGFGGGGANASLFQQLMPALQNNPGLADQIARLLQSQPQGGQP